MSKKRVESGGVWEMVTIAFPMVVSYACEMIMIFTDRVFLSRLDPLQMNAAMGGGLSCFMMTTFFLGLTGYSIAIVAQYAGAKRKDKCSDVISQAFIIAFLAYPIILFFRPLGYLLFNISGLNPVQLVFQKVYFNILIYAVIVSLLRNCLSSFFSGIGRTRIVMLASFIAMIVNVAANYILIYGKFGFPALAIRGAAYGTIIGGITGLLVLFGAYFSKANRKEFAIRVWPVYNRKIMTKLIRFGYPNGLEMFLNVFAFNAIILIFHSRGPVVATAATIMFNWDMVSFVPLLGIEIGVTSLFGRYVGAGRPDIAQCCATSGLKVGWFYSAIILLFFVVFPNSLVLLFKPAGNADIFVKSVPIAIFMLRLAALYVLVEAVFVVFIGALRGAGDTFWAMFLSVSLHWLLIPVLLFILKYLHLSAESGWIAVVTVFSVFSIFVYLRYHSGKWRNIKVLGDDELTQKKVMLSEGLYDPTVL